MKNTHCLIYLDHNKWVELEKNQKKPLSNQNPELSWINEKLRELTLNSKIKVVYWWTNSKESSQRIYD